MDSIFLIFNDPGHFFGFIFSLSTLNLFVFERLLGVLQQFYQLLFSQSRIFQLSAFLDELLLTLLSYGLFSLIPDG
jgi:hypothetical protein